MSKESVIYLIKNLLNNKIYIGSAINFYNRKKQHISALKNNKHHSIALQNAWNKYGEDNFDFEIIEVITESSSLIVREQYYLDKYKSFNSKNGYNICKIAGSTLGFKHTDETKELMRTKRTGVKTRPCSDETKRRISETKLSLDLTDSMKKRAETLLKQDKNIFKKIGNKSSITQKINGLNKGINNPNSNIDDLLIFNELNEIVFTTNNLDFINLCNENHLPKRALLKSKYSDGEYKLYLKQSPKNNEFLKYKGWYCKYKK